MITTRTEVTQSVDATRAALLKLTPGQVEDVRERVSRELLDFIKNEWIPKRPK
jgi:hypothetical protein